MNAGVQIRGYVEVQSHSCGPRTCSTQAHVPGVSAPIRLRPATNAFRRAQRPRLEGGGWPTLKYGRSGALTRQHRSGAVNWLQPTRGTAGAHRGPAFIAEGVWAGGER